MKQNHDFRNDLIMMQDELVVLINAFVIPT